MRTVKKTHKYTNPKITQVTNFTKDELWKLYILQNKFALSFFAVSFYTVVQHFESILALLVYFVLQFFILNIVFGFVVFDSIWERCSKLVFENISKTFQKCPRSVDNFRTDHFCEMFGDFGPKWSPKYRCVVKIDFQKNTCNQKLLVGGIIQ